MDIEAINKAAHFLKEGEVIAIPTETVYGLAANIYNEEAVRNIFNIKQRPATNPLIVHIGHLDQLNDLVSHIPDQAKLLMEKFWPGPLTLILNKKANISDLITAGLDTVGVRMPNHPTTLSLLTELDFPLAAPSANPFGSISPTKASHVEGYFKNDIPMVLDGGECKKGIESTIVGFEDDQAVVYRLGSISIEDVSEVIGEVMVKNHATKSPNAPGMIARHYAPNTNTILVDNVEEALQKHPGQRIGTLTFKDPIVNENVEVSLVLSKNGSLDEAMSNLYQSLHDLDQSSVDLIILEKMPNEGLGLSMNDRLKRASTK